jgi:hypothetical protein
MPITIRKPADLLVSLDIKNTIGKEKLTMKVPKNRIL